MRLRTCENTRACGLSCIAQLCRVAHRKEQNHYASDACSGLTFEFFSLRCGCGGTYAHWGKKSAGMVSIDPPVVLSQRRLGTGEVIGMLGGSAVTGAVRAGDTPELPSFGDESRDTGSYEALGCCRSGDARARTGGTSCVFPSPV